MRAPLAMIKNRNGALTDQFTSNRGGPAELRPDFRAAMQDRCTPYQSREESLSSVCVPLSSPHGRYVEHALA